MRARGGIERVDLPVLRELKGRMRAFRNMHSVTVLNVPQLRELSVSVAFVDVKEVKMENASLFGKCEELKRVVEKKSDDGVVRVEDVGVLPVEKRVVEGNDCCCDCDDNCKAVLLFMFLILGGLGCFFAGIIADVPALLIIGFVIYVIGIVFGSYQGCNNPNGCR